MSKNESELKIVFHLNLQMTKAGFYFFLSRISELGVPKYTFGVNWGVQFLLILLQYTQDIWILLLGCPNSKRLRDTPLLKGLRKMIVTYKITFYTNFFL